jgi:hypothetical protein
VRRSDQEGRRWAKGDVALKFVVKVNVARVVRVPYTFRQRALLALRILQSHLNRIYMDMEEAHSMGQLTIAIQI